MSMATKTHQEPGGNHLVCAAHIPGAYEAADQAHNTDVKTDHRDERKHIPIEYNRHGGTLHHTIGLKQE